MNIALIGNANTGKSTLFNLLTGLQQKTGNFAGVTVEKYTGTFSYSNIRLKQQATITITDLPGISSLYYNTLDEKVSIKSLLQDSYDKIVVVVDATQMKQGLVLATQLIDLQLPVLVVINRIDLIENKIDTGYWGQLLQTSLVLISAKQKIGISELKTAIAEPSLISSHRFTTDENYRNTIQEYVPQNASTTRSKDVGNRYEFVQEWLLKAPKMNASSIITTAKIDKVITNKYTGIAIFLLLLFTIFQLVFYIAPIFMDYIESAFAYLAEYLSSILPDGLLKDLLVDGVIAGLSGTLVFIPQIALLFLCIALMEDSGYMARVSFILDKLMRKFGLNGKSVIPLMSGVACAVPAIIATRTIANYKERLITILVVPFMSCSARLPVYTILIALVIPNTIIGGFIQLQGVVLFGLYMIGFLAALIGAWVLSTIVKNTEKNVFFLHLPIYQIPNWKSIGIAVWNKIKLFSWEVGKVVVSLTILLWALASFGPSSSRETLTADYEKTKLTCKDSAALAEAQVQYQSTMLEKSYLGIAGKAIEPVILPLGYDWKIGIGLITSFAAREVFVGTMSVLYRLEGEDTDKLAQKMAKDKNPITGEPLFNLASGISLLLFYTFALQCMSTLGVVVQELKSWKMAIFQFIIMGVMAYMSAWLAYNGLK